MPAWGKKAQSSIHFQMLAAWGMKDSVSALSFPMISRLAAVLQLNRNSHQSITLWKLYLRLDLVGTCDLVESPVKFWFRISKSQGKKALPFFKKKTV
jgi:hypothetical protein